MQTIQAQSVALKQDHYDRPSTALGDRGLADRDFTVVAAFVIIGLLVSLCVMLVCPWLEVSVVLSTLS
jgi:hypothetical protein